MKYLSILLTALLLTCVAGDDCTETYQKLLNDAVELKKNCSDASPKDCCQIKKIAPWSTTGSYEVSNVCEMKKEAFGVYTHPAKLYARCDMESAGGKWMVIQRRINGSVNFYRKWDDYVSGFGDLEGEFWYGLEKIHCLTTREDVELRIELGNGTDPSIVWTYQLFRVGGANTNYQLTIGQGTGVGGKFDAMAYHNGKSFTTQDHDHDASSSNCATTYKGAWWYNTCYHSHLNGRYHGARDNLINWHDDGRNKHFTKVQMKIRPKQCSGNREITCF